MTASSLAASRKVGYGSFPPTNDGNRCVNKLPSNSPELCRALDSHGFLYSSVSMKVHTLLTSILPHDDARRFSMGSPDQVWSSLELVLHVAPTPAQIVADVMALPRVLDKIIEAEGAVVPDLFLRSGRRVRRADDKGDCDTKVRKRQRKSTHSNLPLHPDCQAAVDMLSVMDFAEAVEAVESADEELAPDDAAMDPTGN